MCAPVGIIAGATAAVGQLVGGYAAMQQGNYEAEVARRNAGMEIEAARNRQERVRDEAVAFYRQLGQVKGQQTAAIAANGVDVGFGSAERTAQDTAALGEEDATNLYRGIYERTRGHEVNVSNFVAEARAARSRGRTAMVSSTFDAANSLISGMQQQSMMRARLGSPNRTGRR